MARSIDMAVRGVVVLVLGGDAREVFEYVDGTRSNTPRVADDGRPLWRVEAAVEVGGQAIGACAVLTCTPEAIKGQPMGTRLVADVGRLKVTPDSQFEIRVTVTAPTLSAEKRQAAA